MARMCTRTWRATARNPLLTISCASLHEQDQFLQTSHAPWNAYLDEVVDVHLDGVPIDRFPGTLPFQNLNALIVFEVGTGSPAVEDPFTEAIVDADATMTVNPDNVTITFHAENITRREALRRISRQTGFKMTWAVLDGMPRAVLMEPE